MGIEKGMFPEEKRIEVVTLFAATGNLENTSELSGVPVQTIRAWRKADWFYELLREVRNENNAVLDAKFTQIVDKSLDQIVDRIENGDSVLTRDGELVKKPMSGKDLSLVAAINVDKRQLLRGEPTSRSESLGGVEAQAVGRLEKLAETFENLARLGRVPKTHEMVTDAELITDTSGRGANEASPEGHQN